MNHFQEALSELSETGIRNRIVSGVNGLTVNVIESGSATSGLPLVVLLHGFPELGYSWRKILSPLAEAGYYVVAPDQRGYGATRGWNPDYEGDLSPFQMLNLVTDIVCLVDRLGYRKAEAVIGHDAGAGVAAWCSLIYPDIFNSVVLMSAPFSGPPSSQQNHSTRPSMTLLNKRLGELAPPRKHYQWYFSSRSANPDMMFSSQGLHAFLRAYYHYKSADWSGNEPHRLQNWSAEQLSKLPEYYIMPLEESMAQVVAHHAPAKAEDDSCKWLSETELAVYVAAFSMTTFQGGLQWYRCGTSQTAYAKLKQYRDQTIQVPSCFISGAQDWGVFQSPGSYERMRQIVCSQMIGCFLLPDAGHWVQQEQPHQVVNLLLEFLKYK